MYKENGNYAHKLTFGEDEKERIEQNAEEMDMRVGEYIKFALRTYEQEQ